MPAIGDQVAVRLKDGLPGTELRLMLESFSSGVRRRRACLFRQDRFGCEKRRCTQSSTNKGTETNTAKPSEESVHCLRPIDSRTISELNVSLDDLPQALL